jgi:hypothetical protein
MNELLLRYIAGALPPDEEAALEARLFDDEELTAHASRLLAVRDALRAMAGEGPLVPVVTAEELRALGERVKVTEHHPSGGVVRSHITDEVFVAAHIPLRAPASRVHVSFCTPEGHAYFRVHEAPFDPASGEVIILCERHVAIATGRLTIRVVDDAGALLAEVPIESS